MPKVQIKYVCQSCGFETPRWVGKCGECDAWNSFIEEVRVPEKSIPLGKHGSSLPGLAGASSRPQPITQVAAQNERRISSGIGELNRVLGGGIVDGALMLVGGDPGIGKSTLMTQVAHAVSSLEVASRESRVERV